MYAVNLESTRDLVNEYNETFEVIEKLLQYIDPEETPFTSKYEARTQLDTLCNKLEATKTVALMEKNSLVIIEMSWRIASVKVKLGCIHWDVEEPHNAQTDLDAALKYYFPGFLEQVNTISGELSSVLVDSKGHEDLNENTIVLPDIQLPQQRNYLDAMKCLNMLGILWHGRQHYKRSLMYFYYAKQFYTHAKDHISNNEIQALESLFTHNMFYLAQAYGNIGNVELSCKYCYETLSRQVQEGLKTIDEQLEWCKNTQAISDFYLVKSDFKSCHCALLSCEAILSTIVVDKLTELVLEKYTEVQMDLQRRYVKFDVVVLQHAYERDVLGNRDNAGTTDDAKPVSSSEGAELEQLEFFAGIKIQLKTYHDPAMVLHYEDARAVFLRAVSLIETCKKHFLMDGYVTDHVALVEDNSKLYLYLQSFESDSKRKMAMQSRRVDMLQPFLEKLSKTAYEVQHKQIAYELGEIQMSILELKMEKLKQITIKKTDIMKYNETSRLAIASFLHFISMYCSSTSNTKTTATVFTSNTNTSNLFILTLDQLVLLLTQEYDDGNITMDEIRPFLNAHFLCARILSKIIVPPTEAPQLRSKYVVLAWKHYEWLAKKAVALCQVKQQDVQQVFGAELSICNEMVTLLPAKINRIHYTGEVSFDL